MLVIIFNIGFPSLTSSTLEKCPKVTFNCFAVVSDTLRWFFNGDTFALYSILPNAEYPFQVRPLDGTPYAQFDGVDMQILAASPTEENNFYTILSSMMIDNISALLEEEVSTVGCGSLVQRQRVNISYG